MLIPQLFGAALPLAASTAAYHIRQAENQSTQILPVIDLGYELYQASGFNVIQSPSQIPIWHVNRCSGDWKVLQLLKYPIFCEADSIRAPQ